MLGHLESPVFPRKEDPALARFQQTPTAAPDDSEKLDGLLLGQQSSHQRAAQLTAGLGVDQSRVEGGRRSLLARCDRPAHGLRDAARAALLMHRAASGMRRRQPAGGCGCRTKQRGLEILCVRDKVTIFERTISVTDDPLRPPEQL